MATSLIKNPIADIRPSTILESHKETASPNFTTIKKATKRTLFRSQKIALFKH